MTKETDLALITFTHSRNNERKRRRSGCTLLSQPARKKSEQFAIYSGHSTLASCILLEHLWH